MSDVAQSRLAASPFGGDGRVMACATPALACIAAYLTAALALAVSGWPDAGLAFRDTDDAMRLQQVRDLLNGQSWHDLHQWRLDPQSTAPMHWSRIADLPLVLIIAIARLIVAPDVAEKLAVLGWPPLLFVPMLLGMRRIMLHIAGSTHQLAAAVAPLCCLPLLQEFVPGRIDHHGMQLACATWVVAFSLERTRSASARAGAAAALGLAVGLEGLVVALCAGAGYAVAFVSRDEDDGRAAAFAVSLAGWSAGLHFAHTPVARWFVSTCDAIGFNWIVAFAIAAGGLVLARRETWPRSPRGHVRFRRLAVLGLAAVAGAAAFGVLDRACLAGPFGEIDPRIKPIWLDNVREVQPVWSMGIAEARLLAMRYIAFLPLAIAGSIIVARTPRLRGQTMLWAFGAGMVLALAISVFQIRYATYMLVLASPFGAIALHRGAARLRRLQLRPAIGGAALLLGCFGLAVATAGLARAVANKTGATASGGGAHDSGAWTACMRTEAYADLARLSPGMVAAPIDLGPVLLLATPHSVLAAPYHRFGRGILDAHAILSRPADSPAPEIAARGVRYVVTCLGSASAGGLDRSLRAGRVPDWLQRIGGTGPVMIFQVK